MHWMVCTAELLYIPTFNMQSTPAAAETVTYPDSDQRARKLLGQTADLLTHGAR